MQFIYAIIFLAIFVFGAFLAVKSFQRSKAIFWGIDRRFSAAVRNAALTGLSSTLMFVSGMYFITAVTDNSYPIQVITVLMNFALFSVFGLIVFFGSLWQYFMVSLYRDRLINFIVSRKDDKKMK